VRDAAESNRWPQETELGPARIPGERQTLL